MMLCEGDCITGIMLMDVVLIDGIGLTGCATWAMTFLPLLVDGNGEDTEIFWVGTGIKRIDVAFFGIGLAFFGIVVAFFRIGVAFFVSGDTTLI